MPVPHRRPGEALDPGSLTCDNSGVVAGGRRWQTAGMPEIRVLSAEQVRALLDPAELRAALEAALVSLHAGRADVPPRIAAMTPDGLLAAMPGYVEIGNERLLAAKLVSVFAGHTPSHQGLVAVFDAAGGTPRCVMDAEVVTEVRTAATAAIAADLLARSDAAILTIVGAGAQARSHAAALAPLRRWSELRIVNRAPARAVALAEEVRAHYAGVAVNARIAGVAEAVAGADVVALCTHAEAPVVERDWVGDGTHVSSVGSRIELPAALVEAARVVVDHAGAVTSPPPAGAHELQGLDPSSVVELGALVAGTVAGRTAAEQITVYKSTGHAVQDVAAATVVLAKAEAGGVGTVVHI
jgi:ornithine cyclodeaminase/alanine dehydrogenase-like protein (mu-crystallin family)